MSNTITLENVQRLALENYYHSFTWKIPWPEMPAVPLLHTMEAISDVFSARKPVTQPDLTAMETGLLSGVPTTYFLTLPEDVRKMLHRERTSEPPSTQDDLALVEVDLDESPLRQRPSLALLQKPLYTETGLIPRQQRAEVRHARLLSKLPQNEAKSPARNMEAASAFAIQMAASFKHAKKLDLTFASFVQHICTQKLGLLPNESTLSLTKRLLALSKEISNMAHFWVHVCNIASGSPCTTSFGEPQKSWLRDYLALLAEHGCKDDLYHVQNDKASTEGWTVVLRDGQPALRAGNSKAVPCAVLPLFPCEGENPHSFGHAGARVSHLVFDGVTVPDKAPCEPLVLGSKLLLPDQATTEGSSMRRYTPNADYKVYLDETPCTGTMVLSVDVASGRAKYCIINARVKHERRLATQTEQKKCVVDWTDDEIQPPEKKIRLS